MPSIAAFPWKISENDSPTMARKPARANPCGACSRDDPQPKFALTTRIAAPASFESTVRGRGANLAAFETIRVHPEAHRAAGAPPLESRVGEDLVQPARFGGPAHAAGSGNDERFHVRGDVMASDQPRGLFEIRQPPVGARSDERDVDSRARDARARLESHERERFVAGIGGNRLAHGDGLPGVDPPGD